MRIFIMKYVISVNKKGGYYDKKQIRCSRKNKWHDIHRVLATTEIGI